MRGLSIGLATLVGVASIMSACSSDETGATSTTDAGTTDGPSDARTSRDSAASEEDAAPGCNAGAAPDPLGFETVVVDPPVIANKLAGATVDILKRSDRSVLQTATTDAQGKATLEAPTGGAALDALVRFTAPPGEAGVRTSLVIEQQHGFQTKQTMQVGVPPTSLVASSASEVGVTHDPSKAIVQVFVANCTPTGYAGATVTVEGATVFYNKGGPLTFDTDLKATGVHGTGTAFNVTPGLTKITVTYQGETTAYETTTSGGEIHIVHITP